MKTLVVNLFAGAGAGKSTTAAGVFERLKWAGIEVELATEYAKDLVWEDRLDTLSNQIYVFGKQHHRVFRLVGKVDVVITDSPLILSAIYKPDSLSDNFTKVVLEQHKALPSLNFFIERTKPYNPKGRCQDEAGARKIDRKVREFLDTHAIPYTAIKGTPSTVDELADIIKSSVKGLK